MRRLWAVATAIAALIALCVLLGWSLRFRIATTLVDRRLAAARVPASYRLVRIGPFEERLENVRIGDPAAPDLVARRIHVTLGYGLGGLRVRRIVVEGVRLRARLDNGGLHLGAIDRLLPESGGGGVALPDLDLRLDDVLLALATPNGGVRVALAGSGNPARRFDGRARAAAGGLRLASCRLSAVAADLTVAVAAKRPRFDGLVTIGATSCPGFLLGPGTARIAAASSPAFDRVALRAGLGGFAGAAGPLRFAGIGGAVRAEGALGDLAVHAALSAGGVTLPATARSAERATAMLAGTPIGPTVARAGAAVGRLLRGADATATLDAAIRGRGIDVDLRRLDLRGPDGAGLRLIERGGLRWSGAGWRADGDVAIGGGALPAIDLALRQPAAGALLDIRGRLLSYRAGTAAAASPGFRLRWDGKSALVEGRVMLDGPIGGSGFVRGLEVPVAAWIGARGAALLPGCRTIAFSELQLASFRFAATRLPLCGDAAIVAGQARGVIRTGPLRLVGRTTTGAPVALAAAGLRIDGHGFGADRVAATIGAADHQTRLDIARIDGGFSDLGGRFAGLGGRIANVPLLLDQGEGKWRFFEGRLALTGKLRVADATSVARFQPLIASDARLALAGTHIAATADLGLPQAGLATLALAHDLGDGRGHALLDMPGITFAPKGLQPEALTPLTLGVIANVAGTLTGHGRIDWDAAGVTSSGDFGSERIDLAAAFGPVTGIEGRIHFTDLLGLVSAPHQEATIAEINPGVAVADGHVRFQLVGHQRLAVEDARWPFAGGTLRLDPALIDFGAAAERRLTFRIEKLDAARFVQQLDFPNIAATGTFDGRLPMVFDQNGGRIEAGSIVARGADEKGGGGTLAYVGELSNADIGTMGKLAFDALKAIRYSALDISLDGRLDGEMVSQVRFTGVREATPGQTLVTRLIRNLPFRFNIRIRAPFRGLVGSARAYADPRLLLNQAQLLKSATPAEPTIQGRESGAVR